MLVTNGRTTDKWQDYCGTLTEESIRKNFVLLYELLDEMVDYGYPQITNTEQLKLCVHNQAAAVESGLFTLILDTTTALSN